MSNQDSIQEEGQRISYQIAGRTYHVKVRNAAEEEMIRRAVKYISASQDTYRLHYKGRDEQDYLAIMLLQSTMKLLENENNKELKNLTDEISALDNMLGDYLNSLSR